MSLLVVLLALLLVLLLLLEDGLLLRVVSPRVLRVASPTTSLIIALLHLVQLAALIASHLAPHLTKRSGEW